MRSAMACRMAPTPQSSLDNTPGDTVTAESSSGAIWTHEHGETPHFDLTNSHGSGMVSGISPAPPRRGLADSFRVRPECLISGAFAADPAKGFRSRKATDRRRS